ncbi:hypothetical protein BDV25DRAFT_155885 [Aspergillus avenaceus]|uniref:Secreted protein n=1 Tax=Aspergillus avenaceus TaxID=36643 RepID=A0A5N6TTN7_ASPAV|nr:hypothetical protein BDV25DRAFT_155885 [Aspergillus avenaceus]
MFFARISANCCRFSRSRFRILMVLCMWVCSPEGLSCLVSSGCVVKSVQDGLDISMRQAPQCLCSLLDQQWGPD